MWCNTLRYATTTGHMLLCTGMDSLGREVVVFVGKLYPAAKVTESQVRHMQVTCRSHADHM